MMILIISVIVLLVLIFVLYYLRSSKEAPKNWREFAIELRYQVHGLTGYFEDILLRCFNKVGKFKNNEIKYKFSSKPC